MDHDVIDMVINSINELKVDMNKKFDELKVDMNKKSEETEKRLTKIENEFLLCKTSNQNSIKRSELSIRKITAIGGIITATITASATAIVTILKIFYPGG